MACQRSMTHSKEERKYGVPKKYDKKMSEKDGILKKYGKKNDDDGERISDEKGLLSTLGTGVISK